MTLLVLATNFPSNNSLLHNYFFHLYLPFIIILACTIIWYSKVSNLEICNMLFLQYIWWGYIVCILVIVFLFPLNIGVSPCFHCTVLVHVYRLYTSCVYNTVVSPGYRLHTSCLHHAGVTSFFSLNMWF